MSQHDDGSGHRHGDRRGHSSSSSSGHGHHGSGNHHGGSGNHHSSGHHPSHGDERGRSPSSSGHGHHGSGDHHGHHSSGHHPSHHGSGHRHGEEHKHSPSSSGHSHHHSSKPAHSQHHHHRHEDDGPDDYVDNDAEMRKVLALSGGRHSAEVLGGNEATRDQLNFLVDNSQAGVALKKRGMFVGAVDMAAYCCVCLSWALTLLSFVGWSAPFPALEPAQSYVCSKAEQRVQSTIRFTDPKTQVVTCLAMSPFDPTFLVRNPCNASDTAQQFLVERVPGTIYFQLHSGEAAGSSVPFAVERRCVTNLMGTNIISHGRCMSPQVKTQLWTLADAPLNKEEEKARKAGGRGSRSQAIYRIETRGKCLAAGSVEHSRDREANQLNGGFESFVENAKALKLYESVVTADCSTTSATVRWTLASTTNLAVAPPPPSGDFCVASSAQCQNTYSSFSYPVRVDTAATAAWATTNMCLILCLVCSSASLVLSLHCVKEAVVHRLRHADASIRACCWLCPCGIPCLGPLLRLVSCGKCQHGQPRFGGKITVMLPADGPALYPPDVPHTPTPPSLPLLCCHRSG
jgi:hypothetical protein